MSGRELRQACMFCCKDISIFVRKLFPKWRRPLSVDASSSSQGAKRSTSGYEHMRYLVVAPLVCTGLGTWQIARLKQKLQIIDSIKKRYNAEPVHLSNINLSTDSLKSQEYRRVFVRGRFQHEQEMYVDFRHPIKTDQSSQWTLSAGSKSSKGNYGAHVITPFVVDEQDAHRINFNSTDSQMKSPLRILVNRGWVPKTQVNPLKRQSGQIEDTVTVSGFIRTDEKKFLNFLIQETNNKNKPRTYLFRDVTAMAEMCDSEPVMIELDSESGGVNEESPLPGQTLIQIYNKHAEYIATWYGLAVVTGYLWYRHVYKAIPFSRKLFKRKLNIK